MKRFKSIVATVTLMKPHEQKAAAASFIMVFILMAVYFTLRPIRDAMASDWSDTEVSLLWNIQFFLSIGIVAVYSLAVSRLKFKYVVPVVYSAFSASFLLFYILIPFFSNPVLIEKSFYLWVTAFSLLNLSVFWSFMSHIFSKEQGKRLFAFIGAGASAGAIIGPAVPTLFAEALGLDNLMLMASIGLLLVIPIIFYLYKAQLSYGNPEEFKQAERPKAIGGNWWSGFKDTFSNKYLLGIAIFILLYVFISSFIYFQQKNLLADFSRADRAQILGGIDWIVNTLTFVFAFTITGRLVKRLGMGFTLASIPVLLVAGLIILAFAPVIVVLLGLQVARRVGNFSVTRPAREMLFSTVSEEERFKAKPVIDVVVYRGGDAVSGSIFAILTDGLGLGLVAISVIGAGIASLWASVGVYLGGRYDKGQSQEKIELEKNAVSQLSSS